MDWQSEKSRTPSEYCRTRLQRSAHSPRRVDAAAKRSSLIPNPQSLIPFDQQGADAPRSPFPRTSAFTLVELLVVVTIIGILIALLLPAVQSAREAARRIQCGNNVKQLALGVLNHESIQGFFPSNGWYYAWVGHPDRGFGKQQPGGWIYNILPFIEQQSLHDLGASGSGITIEAANAQRLGTPVAAFYCPTRRRVALYKSNETLCGNQYKLTSGVIANVAKNDYAMNAGDYLQWQSTISIASLTAADALKESQWPTMSKQTGISSMRSHVKMADITDGASNTFLIGDKYIDSACYNDGTDMGDNDTAYGGDELDLLRWTGYYGAAGVNLPRQDTHVEGVVDGYSVQWFGSAHSGGLNMSMCDGSVRWVSYAIDPEVYRRLGNRKDSLAIDAAKF
jgi:prepilin-type N-terminal cleavage/methylation domain-containing protein/prepilin-type processing-associated H-X9-DG protein